MTNSDTTLPFLQTDGYCAKCLALTGTLEGLRAVCSDEGYTHWSSVEELLSGSEVCKLCRLVRAPRAWEFERLGGPLRIRATRQNLLDIGDTDTGNGHPLQCSLLEGFEVRDEDRKLLLIHISTEENNPASAIIRRRPVLSEVSGPIAIQQAHTWLSECQESHPQCAAAECVPLPSRLLDLGTDYKASYLYVRSTRALSGPYVALSYCWGCSKQPSLNRDKASVEDIRFELNTLPKTIQDAVFVTRSLGVQYLWVDALCIIQDDDHDRYLEIKAMGAIYKNALLTITPSASTSVWDGFLHNRSNPVPVQMPILLPVGTFGSLHLATWQREDLSKEPVFSRGWTFQEYFFSRRVLLYTEREMLWRCQTHSFVPARRSHLRYYFTFSLLPVQVFEIAKHVRTGSREQQLQVWPDLVKGYGERRLSKPADRVNALVGIATELSFLWNDTYLLGLWYNTMVCNLAWRRNGRQHLDTTRDTGDQPLANVPSWSWLSTNRAIHMWSALDPEDAQVAVPWSGMKSLITIEDLSPHGTSIHLRARTLTQLSFLRAVDERGIGLECDVHIDNESEKTMPADSFIALLGYVKGKRPLDRGNARQTALCLILQSVGPGEFRRIGLLHVWDSRWAEVPYMDLTII